MKLFSTILSVLMFQFLFAQMRVEDIKDKYDVVKFMRLYYPKPGDEYLQVNFCDDRDSVLNRDEKLKKFYDSVHTGNDWFTMDLNHDGKLDLVFCSCNGNVMETFVFLSDSKSGYERKDIWLDDYYYCQYAYKKSNDTLIVGEIYEDLMPKYNEVFAIENDTLICKGNELVELNRLNTSKAIDSMTVAFWGFKRSPDLQVLTVYKDGKARLKTHAYYYRQEIAKWYYLNGGAKEIIRTAGRLPYYKYPDEYYCDVDDGYTWNTTIYFSDRTKKQIRDHMAIGSYGLQTVYQCAQKLFNDKHWRLVSSEIEDKQSK